MAAARVLYELPLSAPEPSLENGEPVTDHAPEPLVLGNLYWFARLRWMAICALAAFGLLALLPAAVFAPLGIRPRSDWPLVTAGVLLLANLAYLAHARKLAQKPDPRGARLNLWSQIILDLCLLTVVIHFLGSLETYAPFIYLVHIVLACIFFSRRQSLQVTVIACVLYLTCITLERSGALAPRSLFSHGLVELHAQSPIGAFLIHAFSAVVVWLVVWYLASRLSAILRGRELELAQTNRRLLHAQVDRARHMLRTTHELKAPFAAIHANTQLLLRGSCGPLSDEAVRILNRIAARCRKLAQEIQEMLQIANLQPGQESPPRVDLDLAEAVAWAIARVGAAVRERQVTVQEQLDPARTNAVEDHLKMLLVNILSNAVAYSQEGGTVRVWCGGMGETCVPTVVVEDDGIGIPEEKLPRIFDDYYRTDEAARYNKVSTGLGLAIVRRVARAHGIRIQVESAPGQGTRFSLRFPPLAV